VAVLFVPDGKAGSILRIDPKTSDYTTFASRLSQLIPEVGIGGISDVAFLNEKAYVLVTLVDDPTFPTSQINAFIALTAQTVSRLSQISALTT